MQMTKEEEKSSMADDNVKRVAGKVWGLTKSTVAAGKSGVERAKPHAKRLLASSVQVTKKPPRRPQTLWPRVSIV